MDGALGVHVRGSRALGALLGAPLMLGTSRSVTGPMAAGREATSAHLVKSLTPPVA